jgi:hypothetical protein
MLLCDPGQEVTNVLKDNNVFIFEKECTPKLPNLPNHLLHCCGVTFQKTCIFSSTHVKTLNLTALSLFGIIFWPLYLKFVVLLVVSLSSV